MSLNLPPFPSYSDSGVVACRQRPTHWGSTRLKFLATLNSSKSEVANVPDDTLITFLPMEAVGENGEVDVSRTRPIGQIRNGYTYLREGDVCIAKITPCFENGKGAIVRGTLTGIAFGTTELIPFRCHESSDAGFLYYVLKSPPFKVDAEASMYGAGGQQRVGDSFAANYEILLPPPEERVQIARFLDYETARIDALIEKQQQLIALLKEKRQAVISHAVTKGLNPNAPLQDSGVEWLGMVPAHWEVLPIRHALRIDNGPRLPINREERAKIPGPYPYWGPTGVLDHIDHFRYEGERVIIGEDGDHFLKFAIWPMTHWASGKFNVNNHAHVVATGAKCSARWFYYSFLHRDLGGDVIAQGVSRLKLTREGLSKLILAVPPLDEQLALIAHIEPVIAKVEATTAKAERQIELLQERRTALISAAVTGKLDVRNWTPPESKAERDVA